jgi:hypothetical protein
MDQIAPPGVTAERRSDDNPHRLPEGWQAIGRCRQGLAGPTGCLVLANPGIGIALVDLAPAITPNAEARFRRLLAASAPPGGGGALPPYLPVGHIRIEPAEWPLLPTLFEATFASLPPLTPSDDPAAEGGWVGTVRNALAADPAWVAAGQRGAEPLAPPAALPILTGTAPPTPGDPPRRAAVPRRPLRRGRLPSWLAFALVFVAGTVTGRLLVSPGTVETPARPGTVRAAETSPAATPFAATATPAGQASPFQDVALADGGILAWAIEAAAALEPPPASARQEVPPEPPAPGPAAAEPDPTPLPPVVAEAPPPGARRAAAPAPRPPAAPSLDRRCADAMYRWQQGEWVGWSEMAYLRQGCVGRTR